MKNKKIIFNLTIDDLKELGIIKKRKRRQRKIKYVNGIPTNLKSVSNHMAGYSNEFKNTDNLKTENLRLQNDVLVKYPEAIKLQSGYEDRFNTMDEKYNNSRTIYENILAQTYRPRIQNNNNLDDDDTLSSDTRVERLSSRYGDPDDDIDVPQTGGSDAWQGYDNVIDDQQPAPQDIPTLQQPQESIPQQEPTPSKSELNVPQTQQAGIRSPLSMIVNSFRASKIVPTNEDESNGSVDDIVNSSVGDGYNYKFVEEEDEKKSDSPNPQGNTKQAIPEEDEYAALTEENLEKHTGKEANEQQTLTAYQKHQIAVEQAKQEYRDAGGNDDRLLIPKKVGLKEIREATKNIQLAVEQAEQAKQEYRDAGGNDSEILTSSNINLGSIRAATILLQNETAKSTKKKSKKNKK